MYITNDVITLSRYVNAPYLAVRNISRLIAFIIVLRPDLNWLTAQKIIIRLNEFP